MKSFAKQFALQAVELLGINRFYRYKTRNRLLGLCYHGVIANDADWSDPKLWLAVAENQFERQMREIRNYWKPLSLREIDLLFQRGEPFPERAVFVSFDDGYWNNLSFAAPILKKYDIPATVFLTTGLIENGKMVWALELFESILDWPDEHLSKLTELMEQSIFPALPALSGERRSEQRYRLAFEILRSGKQMSCEERNELMQLFHSVWRWSPRTNTDQELYRMLNWEEVKELSKFGIDVGAHTVSHCNLARATPAEAENEMRISKAIIEQKLGVECFSLAYPFGNRESFSDSVIQQAQKLGFRIGTTLCMKRNPVEADPFRLDRLCVTGDLNLASFRALIAGWRNC